MTLALRRVLPVLLLAVFACDTAAPPPQQAPPPVVRAQAPPPDEPAPGPDPDIQQTVARISLVTGNDVSFSRGDDPENWQPADLNVPMTLGDRVWTGDDGRIELQVHGGSVVRLAGRTDLQALNLTGSMKQFSLSLGTASFQVRRLADDEVFEVDTPNTAVTFERPGDYRVDVDNDGNTRVQVRRGRAIAAAGGGQVALSAGDEMDIDGIDAPRYDIVAVPRPDGWDQWVAQRDQQLAQARSYTYVTADIAGVEDLDQYGRWQQIPEYGWTWSPISVEAGWAPYRAGRWIWQDPWGWTWVAAEPWGWAPYHYGRWVFYGSRWCWVPVGPPVRAVAYSPALVAFVGGIGRLRRLVPARAARSVLSLVAPRPDRRRDQRHLRESDLRDGRQPDDVFVSGRNVSRDFVHDRDGDPDGGRDARAARARPVVPTRDSIRMTGRTVTAAARPPAATNARGRRRARAPRRRRSRASTRRFPSSAKTAARPSRPGRPRGCRRRTGRSPPRACARSRPRPADVTLAPRNDAVKGPRPEPVAPARGRPGGRPTPAPRRRRERPIPRRADTRPRRPLAQAEPRPRPRPARRRRLPPTRPAEASRPPAHPMPPRPTARASSRSPRSTPERAGTERVQAPPPMHERPQPAERIAPEPKPAQRARPTPKPTPTKKPEAASGRVRNYRQ